MPQSTEQVLTRRSPSVLSTNAVLRNTYILLGLTLIFSGLTAALAMFTNAPPLNPWITIIGYMALLFVTNILRNSAWGLVAVFALTGFLGYTLGPILDIFLNTYVNGSQLIITSLGATGVIFLALSVYAITTRKDFSYLAAFLMVGVMVAFLAGLGAMVFNLPALSLIVSAVFILLSSGLILFQTSMIINGGETNYIMATISLYVSLFNLFLSLLQILAAFSGERK